MLGRCRLISRPSPFVPSQQVCMASQGHVGSAAVLLVVALALPDPTPFFALLYQHNRSVGCLVLFGELYIQTQIAAVCLTGCSWRVCEQDVVTQRLKPACKHMCLAICGPSCMYPTTHAYMHVQRLLVCSEHLQHADHSCMIMEHPKYCVHSPAGPCGGRKSRGLITMHTPALIIYPSSFQRLGRSFNVCIS